MGEGGYYGGCIEENQRGDAFLMWAIEMLDQGNVGQGKIDTSWYLVEVIGCLKRNEWFVFLWIKLKFNLMGREILILGYLQK